MSANKRPSVRMDRQEIWDFVSQAHTGMFTTLRRSGAPVTLPVWFAALDEAVFIGTPALAKKVLRLRHDGRSAFAVEIGERWAELKGVSMTGSAVVLVDDDDAAIAARTAMDAKYAAFRTDRSDMPEATAEAYEKRGASVIIRFVPDERILSWNNAALGV